MTITLRAFTRAGLMSASSSPKVHTRATQVTLKDKVRGIRKVGWFDSPIRHEARDECDIDLSFQFPEARI
jgi:hypothetical protein